LEVTSEGVGFGSTFSFVVFDHSGGELSDKIVQNFKSENNSKK